MNLLSSISRNIYPLNKRSMDAAQERWNNLIHPKGSLGRVEDICVQMAGIYETEKFDIPKKAIIAFGADHGVYMKRVLRLIHRKLQRYSSLTLQKDYAE